MNWWCARKNLNENLMISILLDHGVLWQHHNQPKKSCNLKLPSMGFYVWHTWWWRERERERESKKECKKVSTWEKQVDEESKGPLNNPAAAMTDRSKTRSPIATPGLGSPPSLGLNTPYGKFSKGKWFPEPTSTNDFAGLAITEKTQPHQPANQPVSQHPKPKLPQKNLQNGMGATRTT
jgi:hypothetical protein